MDLFDFLVWALLEVLKCTEETLLEKLRLRSFGKGPRGKHFEELEGAVDCMSKEEMTQVICTCVLNRQ